MSACRSSSPSPTVSWTSSSEVTGAPEPGEDLPADRIVPVPERRPGHQRGGRPRPAAEDLVVGAVEHLGVLLVGEGDEAGVGGEVGRRPLPHVAQHLLDAVPAGAVGIGPDRRRAEVALAEVGVHWRLTPPLSGGHPPTPGHWRLTPPLSGGHPPTPGHWRPPPLSGGHPPTPGAGRRRGAGGGLLPLRLGREALAGEAG